MQPQQLPSCWLRKVFAEITLATVLFLISASFFAGFVDSIAGGGGLIQLPALLIGLPKTDTVTVLGTNKLGSVFGTTTAAALYRRQIKPDIKVLAAMAIPAFIGSAIGASLASRIPTQSMRPIVLVLLIVVAIYTWIKPDLGKIELLRHASKRRIQISIAAGLIIGFYDGIFGPGTGSFLMLILVASLGYAFITASAIAKVVNYLEARIDVRRGQCCWGNFRFTPGYPRWISAGAQGIPHSHGGINRKSRN
jgi:uncharacterized membrane protein YfcA